MSIHWRNNRIDAGVDELIKSCVTLVAHQKDKVQPKMFLYQESIAKKLFLINTLLKQS